MSFPDLCQFVIFKYVRKKAKKLNRLLCFYLRNLFVCNVVQICAAICLKQLGCSTKLHIKATLMQIWKPPYMFIFIWNKYPENFTFFILKILELFTGKHTETIEYVKK